MAQAFQKSKHYQNLTTESGSKQRFSLLQEKVVIKAVGRRNHAVLKKPSFRLLGYGYFVKVRKNSTASDQNFLSCVK